MYLVWGLEKYNHVLLCLQMYVELLEVVYAKLIYWIKEVLVRYRETKERVGRNCENSAFL